MLSEYISEDTNAKYCCSLEAIVKEGRELFLCYNQLKACWFSVHYPKRREWVNQEN
jgi:hypothetical protein